MVDVQQLRTTQLAAQEQAPVGAWAGAPSLAATTVAMENTSGYDVEVTITGGTFTVVKKNAVAITSMTSAIFSTVPARVLLKPGATLSITYSGAPTLQWMYA